jgi:hypothetical protein
MATKIDRNIIDVGRCHPVKIGWRNSPEHTPWNEVCAWMIEHFGLPGHRYETALTDRHITFWFADPQDQILAILRWGNDE